jgi:hypothetical protein
LLEKLATIVVRSFALFMKPLTKVELVKPIELESSFLSNRGKKADLLCLKEQS